MYTRQTGMYNVRVHIHSTTWQLLCNTNMLSFSKFFHHCITFDHPSLSVRCFQRHSHLTGALTSQDTDGGELNERRGLLRWESGIVSTFCLSTLVISLKRTPQLVRTGGLICPVSSSLPLPTYYLIFFPFYQLVWDGKYCEKSSKSNRKEKQFPLLCLICSETVSIIINFLNHRPLSLLFI